MKTDIEIKDVLYEYIKNSELIRNVTGSLEKRRRPYGSTLEDVVISILANHNAQLQEAYVNVNIYVADQNRKGQYEENTQRLYVLCKLAEKLFNSYHGEDFWITLEEQRIYEVEATHEHMINNKILYRIANV